ncbi:MAG TPA: hypothetical protein VM661_16605 [Candidatus Sulfotelmatobacter sp.]|jgi:hypothetical protein|nr:hypothetical protein [Candidatus Sulfotelmatobacter sp.]
MFFAANEQGLKGGILKSLLKIVSVALFALSVSACASSRSVVTLDQAKATPAVQPQAVAVKIVQVMDARYFDAPLWKLPLGYP